MKKMTAIGYTIATLISFFIGFYIAAYLAVDKYKAEKTDLQAAIDNEKHESLLLEKQVADLTEEKAELHGKISCLTDEIETLNDVIVRMRTAPEANKLLKERIPYGMTNTIRFMDYRTINDTASWQYKLQQECETTVLSGIRIYTDASGNEYLCTALGSAYGRDIGDTWHVTLDCGTEFDIIYAEYKDDGTTDFFGHPDDNYDGQDCINILEFIVDVNQMPTEAFDKGTFTALSYFGGLSGNGGNVAKMKYTGKVW